MKHLLSNTAHTTIDYSDQDHTKKNSYHNRANSDLGSFMKKNNSMVNSIDGSPNFNSKKVHAADNFTQSVDQQMMKSFKSVAGPS